MTTVFVIEDNADVRGMVKRLLTSKGYKVVESAYGQDGYARAALAKPEIILLDLMIPVMEGFDVLAELKNHQETRTIPVIILTARIDAEPERRCMRSGENDYVKKPWGPGELEDRIAMALGHRGRDREEYRTQAFHQNC